MGQEYPLIEILFFAALAAFFYFRLRSVFGKRTGHERPPSDPYTASEGVAGPTQKSSEDKKIANAGERADQNGESPRDAIEDVAPAGSALNQALTEIQIADRTFDVDGFINGASGAYEMIVTAFAAGDRDTLKPLLSEDVFTSFAAAIDAREASGETHKFEFVSLRDAQITGASLQDKVAELTVSFEAHVIKSVTDTDGELISGDPETAVTVVDIWTFSRHVKSKTPNWLLVGTDTAE